ncbi:MAG: hypothetical protein IK020_09930 [Clostridiales bacterium]|nr:hypothetical protein [Clostridiales bacterium]MBR5975484.1 hypothetical protein [Clostridiales bacterium]
MRVSNSTRRITAVALLLAIVLSFSGCSKLPFFNSDNKTKDDYQIEATELALSVLKRMLAGSYDDVKPYVDSEDRDRVQEVLSGMADGLFKDATITIESVFTEDKTYDTQVQFRITVAFAKHTTSIMCVMKLARYSGSWRIYNAIPFCSDLSKLNNMYIDGKAEDAKALK